MLETNIKAKEIVASPDHLYIYFPYNVPNIIVFGIISNLLLPTRVVPEEREADITPRISPNQFSTIMIKCKRNTRALNFPYAVYVRAKLYSLYYTEKCKCTHCA